MKKINIIRLNKIRSRFWLLISLLVVVTLFRNIPSWGWFYTRHIYPLIGAILSHLSGIFPFAIGDIFIACSITWCITYPIYKIICIRFSDKNISTNKKAIIGKVLEYILWIYTWFYLSWGINYSQPNIYSRINMKPVEVSKVKLKEFAYRYADSLNYLSENLTTTFYHDCKVKESYGNRIKTKIQKDIINKYMNLHQKIGINKPFNSNAHAKTMVFSHLSSMAGVTGSMGPFFCEFTINGDVLPHDYAAIYAHEFAHFLGVANEGEANFYSYIICTSSSDKNVRFSGYYQIFFHVVDNVFDILGEKEGEKYLKHIRPEIIQLARNDRKYWLSKRSITLDKFQNFIFNLYLQGNHIPEGRKSYSDVIGLILAWEQYSSNKNRCH